MAATETIGGRTRGHLQTLLQLFVVGVLMLLGGPLPSAQTRPAAPPAAPADPAEVAYNTGRYDEVEDLLRADTRPHAIALRARAHIARGRYAEAEKLLTGAVAASATGEPALELGLLQLHLGRRQEGRRTLQRILDALGENTTTDLVRLGRAARALGQFHEANDFFRQANRAAPDDAAVNVAWGQLFLEKYNNPDAMKSFQDALRVDPNNVEARIGVAQAALEQNPPMAKSAIDAALKINPNYVPAHLLAAEMALDDRRRDDARTSIDAALKINPRSLEAMSIDAAVAFLEGRAPDFAKKTQEVLAINPQYGEVFRVAGDHAARNYRFDEAAELTRRALSIDAENARASADLGLHLLRTGDERGARESLERAFKLDPFKDTTKNSLEMLDKVDKFETIRDGDLVLRFAPEEAAVMREQAIPFARAAMETQSKRWDFKPTGPILIEMFPVHDDFAVRTIGLPGMIGALGACFGRVVTLDSPKARPPGEYNWQPTLWHELAHVITLQMSNNRVPRWLTEGISVWEEKQARPEWGREMEVSFAHALDEGKVMKLDVLNEGFSDPRLISLAYYEASLVVDHLISTYGFPSMRNLLRAYGRGLETDAALKEAYNLTIDQLQSAFDTKLEKEYGALRLALKRPEVKGTPSLEDWKMLAADNPGSFPVQIALGQALHKAGDKAGAIQAFERAAQLIPLATGDDNPNKMIAAVALEQGDNARAIKALDAVVRVDHADIESARKLASLVAPLGDPARAQDAYQRVVDVDPFDTTSQTGLGRLALQRKDAGRAIPAFRTALAANPPDRAAAHMDLAEAYMLAGQPTDAKRETLAALEIAPSFERAQDLLLKIVDTPAR